MAAATAITVCHNVISPASIQKTLQIFCDRLGNELTRDASLKALTQIALNSQKREQIDSPLIPLQNLS
jgi:hypothetical protein